MMIEVPPQPADLDQRALRVFLKAIELVGGPRGLVERRRLTWLPSLMEAAFAVVLHEEHHRTTEEIAQFLGLSSAAVRNMLRAPTEAVVERLQGEEPAAHNVHIAGGLARLAYQALRREASSAGA
uniref:Regulator n=1 Tax=Thermorudis peleae TaxID=1382356 RepID=A0A831WZI9_9BACT